MSHAIVVSHERRARQLRHDRLIGRFIDESTRFDVDRDGECDDERAIGGDINQFGRRGSIRQASAGGERLDADGLGTRRSFDLNLASWDGVPDCAATERSSQFGGRLALRAGGRASERVSGRADARPPPPSVAIWTRLRGPRLSQLADDHSPDC